MADQPSPLGVFSKLPPEIRDAIWTKFLPRGFDTIYKRVQKTDLRILLTSKAISDEVQQVLYHKRTFFVNVFPTIRSFTCLMCYDHLGTMWLFNDDYEHSAAFEFFPYHKVDITVNIYEPNPKSPSDRELVSDRVLGIAKILSNASLLGHVTLVLHKWDGGDYDSSRSAREILEPYNHLDLIVPFLKLLPIAKHIGVKQRSGKLEDIWSYCSSNKY